MSRLPVIDEASACLGQASLSRDTGYRALSLSSGISVSTLAYRNYGRLSKKESDFDKQYLTPQEEEVLVKRLLPLVQKGHRCPGLFLRKIAQNVRHKRNSACQSQEHDAKLPGKNWPKALRSRHRELEKAWATTPMQKTQCGKQTCNSMDGWLGVIETELDATRILVENTYNVTSTGVILEFPLDMTELMNDNALRAHLLGNEKGTVITAIECTTASGFSLEPWIIWPSKTDQRDWRLSATSGWYHDHSMDGYLNRKTAFVWIKEVFEPQTAARASGKLRLLISDTLTDYLTRDMRNFCQEKRIRLCHLNSLATKSLQPYSEDCSERLQIALRTEFNQAYSQLESCGKSHFTSVYSIARQKAFELLNTGAHIGIHNAADTSAIFDLSTQYTQLENLDTHPKTTKDLQSSMKDIQKDLANEVLNETAKHCLTKLFDVVEDILASQGSASSSTVPPQRLKFRKQSERLRLKR